jgi:hypothetical protein
MARPIRKPLPRVAPQNYRGDGGARAGFDAEDAVQIQTSFTRFVLALISFETTLLPALVEAARADGSANAVRDRITACARYPNLIEAAPYIATPYHPDRSFAQALELLNVGIEAQLRSSSGKR